MVKILCPSRTLLFTLRAQGNKLVICLPLLTSLLLLYNSSIKAVVGDEDEELLLGRRARLWFISLWSFSFLFEEGIEG